MYNFRTDMADERVDTYKRVNNLTEIDGVKVESKNDEIVTTTTVDVLNENGATALSKEIGKYITMEIKDIKYAGKDTWKDKVNGKDISDVVLIVEKQIIEIDENGKAVIECYNNQYSTPVIIQAETMSKDGQIGSMKYSTIGQAEQ